MFPASVRGRSKAAVCEHLSESEYSVTDRNHEPYASFMIAFDVSVVQLTRWPLIATILQTLWVVSLYGQCSRCVRCVTIKDLKVLDRTYSQH